MCVMVYLLNQPSFFPFPRLSTSYRLQRANNWIHLTSTNGQLADTQGVRRGWDMGSTRREGYRLIRELSATGILPGHQEALSSKGNKKEEKGFSTERLLSPPVNVFAYLSPSVASLLKPVLSQLCEEKEEHKLPQPNGAETVVTRKGCCLRGRKEEAI